jgi:uncharacterized membrane-anchored protein YitT (DUF2179 family)
MRLHYRHIRLLFHRHYRYLLKDFFFIGIGILSATLGLKGFLLPNGVIDGGVTGISLLIAFLTPIPLSLLIVLLNLPFIIMGLRQNSLGFAIKTAAAVSLLALSVHSISIPALTQDKLLIAIFGGFFLGGGIGMAIRGGSVIDGTEVLSLYLNKRTVLTVGDIILIINILIFSVAALLLGMEIALYSVLTYLSASKTVDFIVQGIEEYTGVIIISDKNAEISQVITRTIGRGFTAFKGRKGYGKKGETGDKDILFTVLTRLEVPKLKKEINRIDPEAFMVMHTINEIKGGMIKKLPLHKKL